MLGTLWFPVRLIRSSQLVRPAREFLRFVLNRHVARGSVSWVWTSYRS